MPYAAEWYRVHQVIEARAWGVISLDDMELHTEMCVQLLTEAMTYAPTIRCT